MRAIDADCILVVEAPNHKTGRSKLDMLERFADEFNVHISQFVSGKPVPLIADCELTEDKIVITYNPATMSNTTITCTSVENGLLVNVGSVSVLRLEDSYTEA